MSRTRDWRSEDTAGAAVLYEHVSPITGETRLSGEHCPGAVDQYAQGGISVVHKTVRTVLFRN